MAPVTRRNSAAAPLRRNGNDPKTRKARQSPPSPLKSAIRKRLQAPIRGRQVTFQTEDDDDADRIHLPTTPHPSSNQVLSSSQDRLPARAPIDHSKRKEQEELLKRAARILDARAKKDCGLPTPPQSPLGASTGPFDEPEQTKEAAETAKQALTTDVESPVQATSPTEDKFVMATSRHIDIIVDNIPDGLKMPATIDNILIEPDSNIKMEEICIAFDFLKAQIQLHCREFYSHTRSVEDQVDPSLTYLKVKHPELFQYIQYVADGSQYGWDKLIKIGNQRENLVYAIISRALISYVFDAELFGASAEHDPALLEMCREYLHYDAFVRNTHRAEIITSILLSETEKNFNPRKSPYTYFYAAITLLERRINLLLQPLRESNPASSPLLPQESLHVILQTALKIHLAIRLGGANGTVYRFQYPHKLSPWDADNMNCVNQRKMDLSVHHGEEALVKISCFPAVFATVPSGPNLEKFTDPDFVEAWKETADPDAEEGKGKPIITEYPITLADVVLENTPIADRSGFVTSDQAMRREQMAMSDQELLALTGIDRKRNDRITKIVKRTRKAVKGLSVGLAAAAATWYLYQINDKVAPALGGLLKQAPQLVLQSIAAAASKPTVTVIKPTTMTLTPETLLNRPAAAYIRPP